MTEILIVTDPSGIRAVKRKNIKIGENIMGFFIKEYGTNGFGVNFKLFKGVIDKDNEVELGVNGHIIENSPYTLILYPEGVEMLATVLISTLVGFGASYVASQLLPKPTIPNTERNAANESPNNSLTAQTNTIRPLERIPTLYGTNRVYPDLICQSYTEYESNLKKIVEWYCVGTGSYSISDIKNDTTKIIDIAGQTVDIIEPNTTISSQLLPKIYDQIDGLDIKPPGSVWSYSDSNINFSNIYGSWAIDRTTPFNQLTSGDVVSIRGSLNNDGLWLFGSSSDRTYFQGSMTYESGSGSRTVSFYNRIYANIYVEFLSSDVIRWSKAARPNITDLQIGDFFEISGCSESSNNQLYQVLNINGYDIEVYETVTPMIGAQNILFEQKSRANIIGGVLVESEFCDVIKLNLVSTVAQTQTTVNYDIIMLDGVTESEVYTYNRTFSNSTTSQIFETVTIVPSDFSINTSNGLIIKLRQNTNETTLDWKWESLTGFNNVNNINYGDVTIIKNIKRATLNPLRSQSQKFNLLATRKLRTYDLENHNIVETLSDTNKFADAILEVLTNEKSGNRDISNIDLENLYQIQSDIDVVNPELGEFNYSFSNKNTTVAEEISTIANACRVFVYREGNVFKFSRDESKPYVRTLFNQRNKKPESEVKTITLQKPSDYNGIEFQWIDKYIGDGNTIFYPEDATNYKKIESAGIKNYSQALNRAKLEYLKMKLKRERVKTVVTKEGLLLSLGDKVRNVDGTITTQINGEITAINSNVISLDTRINWNGNTSGIMLIRTSNGEVEEVNCTKIDEYNVELDNLPSNPIVIGGDVFQIGSLFTLNISENIVKDYTVEKITPHDENYVEIELSNYTNELYAND